MLCGGHATRAHENALKDFHKKQVFSKKDIETYSKRYPAVTKVRCWCPQKHAQDCGCFSKRFIDLAHCRFYKAMCDTGKDPDKFRSRMTALHHHARDVHAWKEGNCDFHAMFVCSCGQCKKGELNCSGKEYRTRHVLTCPFHSLLYEIECDRRAKRAWDIIHPEYGRGHTNQMETAHSVLTMFRPKSWFIYTTDHVILSQSDHVNPVF